MPPFRGAYRFTCRKIYQFGQVHVEEVPQHTQDIYQMCIHISYPISCMPYHPLRHPQCLAACQHHCVCGATKRIYLLVSDA